MWRRNRRRQALVRVLLLSFFGMLLASTWTVAIAQTTDVIAAVETDPVPGDADDLAIWVHPADPSLSTIIGTDKEGGLAVYDLNGSQIQYVTGIEPNNVDLRHGFRLGGQMVDLVISSNRVDQTLAIHRVDPQTRQLVDVGPAIDTGIDLYGTCMYRSPRTGELYVFATPDDEGTVRQWRLTDDGSGGVSATQVRDLQVDSIAEGCVADDELGLLYVAEEDVAIWKYSAEPDGGSDRTQVDTVGPNLEADIEGLTIYYGADGAGYLIASSQGSGEYVIYERGGANAHVGSFQIMDSASIDGTDNTDGIDVVSASLGAAFPSGLLGVHDGDDDSGSTNFKLVPWETVAGSQDPGLVVDTGRDPRGGTPAGLPPATVPPESPEPEIEWAVASSYINDGGDDGMLSDPAGLALLLGAGDEVELTFSNLDVPAGAVLRRAHVQFTASEQSGGPVAISIGVESGDSAGPGDAVTWAPAEWVEGQRGPYQQTPDLSGVLQDLVSAAGWQSGGVVTLSMRAQGEGSRSAVPFESDPGQAPTLRLEYTLDR